MPTTPELSVIILAYRSGDGIVDFLQELKNHFSNAGIDNYELVLVANYDSDSTDDSTPTIAKRLAASDSRIIALTQPKAGMMGWDARQGLQAASGSILALIDGDGQMLSRDIIRLYNVMKSGEFDFVKTYRIQREDGFLRHVISFFFNVVFRGVFPGCFFRDINSKPKLLSRDAFDQMHLYCDGWFLDGEIILESMRLKLSFAEVPTTFRKNEWRGSFVGFATILEMLFSLLKYRLTGLLISSDKRNQ